MFFQTYMENGKCVSGFYFKGSLHSLIFRVIDTAASQLTKTAITVTAIFIVALGYDLWYYLLAYSGLAEYKANSQLQKIGRYSIDYRIL